MHLDTTAHSPPGRIRPVVVLRDEGPLKAYLNLPPPWIESRICQLVPHDYGNGHQALVIETPWKPPKLLV